MPWNENGSHTKHTSLKAYCVCLLASNWFHSLVVFWLIFFLLLAVCSKIPIKNHKWKIIIIQMMTMIIKIHRGATASALALVLALALAWVRIVVRTQNQDDLYLMNVMQKREKESERGKKSGRQIEWEERNEWTIKAEKQYHSARNGTLNWIAIFRMFLRVCLCVDVNSRKRSIYPFILYVWSLVLCAQSSMIELLAREWINGNVTILSQPYVLSIVRCGLFLCACVSLWVLFHIVKSIWGGR